MLIVGLTGGIGSGKSVVATLFAERGVPIIDTDKVARELTQPGEPALARIIKHFGEHLLLTDGSLDRPALRHIVFSHTQQRLWLEDLLHPLILKETELQIKKISAIYCIVVVPLLLEVECYSFINRILVVDTSEESQIKRIEARDHMSLPQIQAILQTQARRPDRLAHAHDIIVNEGPLTDLVHQVDVLHQMYLHLGEQKPTPSLSS